MKQYVWRLAKLLHHFDFAYALPLMARLPVSLAYTLARWRGALNGTTGRDWRSMGLGFRHIHRQSREAYAQLKPQASEAQLDAWRRHLLDSIGKIERDGEQQNTCDILLNRCELNGELEPLHELEQQRSAFFIESTQRLFEQARDAGLLRPDADLAMAALAMHGMINGLIRLWLRQSGGFPLRDTVEASADMLLSAARVR